MQSKLDRIVGESYKLMQQEEWEPEYEEGKGEEESRGYLKQTAKAILVSSVGALAYVGYSNTYNQNVVGDAKDSSLGNTLAENRKLEGVHDQLDVHGLPSKGLTSHAQSQSRKRTLAKRALGETFQVNTFSSSQQRLPSVAHLNSNEFVVTWGSDLQDGFAYGIFGQRFSRTGDKIGAEFQVNTYVLSGQNDPAISRLADGRFVVVWESSSQDGSGLGVYAQLFNSTGDKIGPEFQVNTYIQDNQRDPSVTSLSTGGFVVTWMSEQDQDGSREGIYGQIYNLTAQKIGVEFLINNYTISSQRHPTLAALSNGSFVVVWQSSFQDGSGYGVYAQRVANTGSKMGPEFQVNTYTVNNQWYPHVASLKNGDFVVVWTSDTQESLRYIIYAQRFNQSGYKVGGEFRVNTYTVSEQPIPQIVALESGGFLVVWRSAGRISGADGLYGQRFDESGDKLGTEFQVSALLNLYSGFSFTTDCLTDESCVVVWTDEGQSGQLSDLYGKILSDIIRLPSLNFRRNYTENNVYFFFEKPLEVDLYYKPQMNISLTIPKGAGRLLSPKLPNVTSHFSPETSTWYVSGALDDINALLKAMIFIPNDFYDKPFTVNARVTDSTNYASPVDTAFDMNAIPVNQAPVLVNNTLPVNQDQILTLNSAHLGVYDVDTLASNLTLSVLNIKNGRFELKAKSGTPISQFTQYALNQGDIQFVADDSGLTPSGQLTFSDGEHTVGPAPLTFSFTAKKAVNPAAIAVPLGAAGLVLIFGGIGLYRYRKNKKKAEVRSHHPLADKLYKKLNLKAFEDFKSTEGEAFLRVVETLENKFNDECGYEFDVMSLDALDEFADYLVKAIRQEVELSTSKLSGTTLELKALESSIERIVKGTIKHIQDEGWAPRQGVVKDKFDFDDSDNDVEMLELK